MSIAKTIIQRSQNYSATIQAQEIIRNEAFKGCSKELSTVPVCLEPKFSSYPEWIDSNQDQFESFCPLNYPDNIMTKRFNCRIGLDHELQWHRAERFLKTLSTVNAWVGFEIIGNSKLIEFRFLIQEKDEDILQNAFNGELINCGLNESKIDQKYQGNNFFYDFIPTTPYHHLQTEPKELQVSPYESFIRSINELPESESGFIQVIFQPAENNWQQNVERLTDIEFLAKTINDPYSPTRIIQPPSSELKNLANKIEIKAHNDKPFYFTSLRAGIITGQSHFNAWPLLSCFGLIQRGKRPFDFLTEREYQKRFDQKTINEMFQYGLTYRPGFLLNSSELTSLIHIPTIKDFVDQEITIDILEKLRLHNTPLLNESELIIGSGWLDNDPFPISVDETARRKNIHIIGKPGTGKTTLLENMILQDIKQNKGLVFLDPHGDSVNRLLELIPQDKIAATIYLNFGDPNWIPLWNPLQSVSKQYIGRAADDLVTSIKNIVQSHSWGDRLEHILRNCFYGLLHLENSNFFDLLILLEHQQAVNSSRKRNLINDILEELDDKVARLFWTRDYEKYRREDFNPPLHKLSKLLTSNITISSMLTQSENRIHFSEIMESNKYLLVDLSNLGSEAKSIMGSFLLAFFHTTFLSRNMIKPDQRKLFSIYCDEAYKFTPDALEDMLVESRKFGVNLTLAHQYLNQFTSIQKDALSSTGTTIIFNTDLTDARYLIKDLQEKVAVKDITGLKVGEAIGKLNSDILKINTAAPQIIQNNNFKDEIINRSHNLYYSSKKENVFSKSWNKPAADLSNMLGSGKQFKFDEFD